MEVLDDSSFDWQEYDVQDEIPKVIPMSEVTEDVVKMFYGDEKLEGAELPWQKTSDKGIRIRSGEVTVYAGINGHWKSMVTSQIALHLMRQGEPVCMASFEMLPKRTMGRMVRQALGTAEPSDAFVRKFHAWTDGRGFLFNHLGRCSPRKALAVMRYVAAEKGVKHFFLDSLMKVIDDVDDYSGQKLFIEDACAVAKATGMHNHIVAHARKSQQETDRIDKFSIKGASEIGDQADNLWLCQRDKKKDAERAAAKGASLFFDESEKPDFYFTLAKQRHEEYEGTMSFWFNPKSLCLVEKAGAVWPGIYLGGEHEPVETDQ